MLIAPVGTNLLSCGTIDKSLVTTTEHVAIAKQHTGFGAYLATMDMYVGGAEDIALRTAVHGLPFLVVLEKAFAAPVVVTSATTEDVAHDMSAP